MKFLIIMAICLIAVFAGSFLIAASLLDADSVHLLVLGYTLAILGCVAFGAKVMIHLPRKPMEN